MLIQIQDKGVDFVDNKDLNSTKELKYPTCGRIGNRFTFLIWKSLVVGFESLTYPVFQCGIDQ